jgi:hypothetical protein
MPSREELADCFAEDIEENWSFPVSVTLIKSYQLKPVNHLIQKAASDDPACAARIVSPFRGGAVICHNDKTAMQLQLRKNSRGKMAPRDVMSSW